MAELLGRREVDAGKVQSREAIGDAEASNMPLTGGCCAPTTSSPRSSGSVLASIGYICDDPYTGTSGVRQLGDGLYRGHHAPGHAQGVEPHHVHVPAHGAVRETQHVFSPLLVRFLSGVDHTTRPVKISDSGRIRNELQTMLSQALEYDGDRIRVRFDRIDEKVMPREKQLAIRKMLEWYKVNHPVWFSWLEIA